MKLGKYTTKLSIFQLIYTFLRGRLIVVDLGNGPELRRVRWASGFEVTQALLNAQQDGAKLDIHHSFRGKPYGMYIPLSADAKKRLDALGHTFTDPSYPFSNTPACIKCQLPWRDAVIVPCRGQSNPHSYDGLS